MAEIDAKQKLIKHHTGPCITAHNSAGVNKVGRSIKEDICSSDAEHSSTHRQQEGQLKH